MTRSTADKLRSRTENRMTYTTYTFTSYNGAPSNGNGCLVGTYRSMSDVVSGDYAKRAAKGEIIMNRMSNVNSTVTSGMLSNLYAETNYGANPQQWVRDTGNLAHIACAWGPNQARSMRYNLISANDAVSTAKEACTRTLSNIGRSNAANWENLAEMRKTSAMLRSPLASWFKFSRKARLASTALSAANLWLAYRYGVRPLVKSVDETLKQLQVWAYRSTEKSRVTTRASAVTTRSLNSTFLTNSTNDGTYEYTVARRQTETLKVRAMSLDEIQMDLPYSLGLGSKDILTLPWELVPFSFVADWFFNVGDYLGAVAQSFYPKSLGQCYVYETIYSEYRETVSQRFWSTANNPVIHTPRLGWVREDTVWKDRYPGLLGPSVVMKTNFRLDDLTRLADAFTLSGQLLLRTFSNRR